MADDIVVTVETPDPVPPVVETVADTVIDKAIELAEVIDDARQEGERKTSEVNYMLEMLYQSMGELHSKINELIGQVNYLADEVASLSAIEVAEIIEENTPKEVEAIIETADAIKETVPDVVANVPAPRKSTKVQWLG